MLHIHFVWYTRCFLRNWLNFAMSHSKFEVVTLCRNLETSGFTSTTSTFFYNLRVPKSHSNFQSATIFQEYYSSTYMAPWNISLRDGPWFLLHCQGTATIRHQESCASSLAALILVFRGFWAPSWAIPLQGTVQLQLHPQHIECLGSTARDSSKIWRTAAGNVTGVPSFSFFGGNVWKHEDVPIPDAFISWKLHFRATYTPHWPLCHGTLEEVKADLTRCVDFRQEPFNPEITFLIGKQVYSNKSPCALQTAMFSFGSRGAISSFCCQHSVSTISSLGTTWVCWALGKLFLAEMSHDGNACGSHLQSKQRTLNPLKHIKTLFTINKFIGGLVCWPSIRVSSVHGQNSTTCILYELNGMQ